jgi:two-component system, OmpR family, sensor histidine kinase CpxA
VNPLRAMRSLFLKIFLSFWLTVVLVGVAWVITWNLQPDVVVSRWRAMMGGATSLYAQASAEEMDRNGRAAVANYLQRLQTTTNIRAYLFDDRGQLIAGRQSDTARQLALHAAESDEAEFNVFPTMAWSARRAVGPSGHAYVFVAEVPRGPWGGLRPTVPSQLFRWILAILLSGSICYLLTRYLTRPILRLQTAARQIADGDLSARAGDKLERRRDEIGELVRDFNQMADRIETLVASQKQLISDISHELRSPLARLTVALGLARQRAGDGASNALDRIEREAERLNDMIGKLLTLAKLGSASAPPERTSVNLSELLQEIVEDASFEAQDHDCNVRLVSSEDAMVEGSPELLRSAIENVVRNAVRYTAAQTDVEVSLSSNGTAAKLARIVVRDHGPGVPDTELQKVFQPFYRLADARERSSGGVGLGLAITDRAVRLHGGSISARNANGGGLEVEIRLPI